VIFLYLLLIQCSIYSAQYFQDQINAGYVARNWNESEAYVHVGYPVKVKFFEDDINSVSHNRVSIFSPGFYGPENSVIGAPSIIEIFPTLPEKITDGWLPGDFFVFDPKCSGKVGPEFRKSVSFGKNEDAFALIYCLNKLYESGINEQSGITIHAQCYGFRRLLYTLYYLSNNEQTDLVENFFLKVGFLESSIDRVRREKLLSMIHSFCLQTPLKQASDGPVSIGYNKVIKKIEQGLIIAGTTMRFGMPFLPSQQNKGLLNLFGIGLFSLPIIFAGINNYFKLDYYIAKHYILPHYYSFDNTNELSENTIMPKLQYLRNENPHWSLFMTTAKHDWVVGNWGVPEFFNSFPVADERKYLIPSPYFGHCKVSDQQIKAKNAFLRKYGSSYYKFPEQILEEGEEILNFAQKGQATNINEYIKYMESEDNQLCD
jgi:hypothetical protein